MPLPFILGEAAAKAAEIHADVTKSDTGNDVLDSDYDDIDEEFEDDLEYDICSDDFQRKMADLAERFKKFTEENENAEEIWNESMKKVLSEALDNPSE